MKFVRRVQFPHWSVFFHGIRPNLSSLTLLLFLIQIFDLSVTLSFFNECKFQEIEDWILS